MAKSNARMPYSDEPTTSEGSEIGSFTSPEALLQMSVKALNDTAEPSGLVPTLLVFGAYPRMTADSPPSTTTLKRGAAIDKAMKSLR